jgi:hypothetical protein
MSGESEEVSGSEPMGFPDHDRSGLTIDESIAKAEDGSQVSEPHTQSVTTVSEDSRLEEIHDAGRNKQSSVEGDSGQSTTTPEQGPGPTDIGSGGAQHVVGARISDRVSAGQPVPDGPPFDTDVVRDPDAADTET